METGKREREKKKETKKRRSTTSVLGSVSFGKHRTTHECSLVRVSGGLALWIHSIEIHSVSLCFGGRVGSDNKLSHHGCMQDRTSWVSYTLFSPPAQQRKYLGDDASFRHLAALVVQARSQEASHRVKCSTVVRNGQRNRCGTFPYHSARFTFSAR